MIDRSLGEPSFLDVGGIRTAYHERGEGQPVLLLHGGDFRTLAHSCDWSLNVDDLALDHRVIALDKLGQGDTGNPRSDDEYTMSAVCDHVEGFIEALGLRDVVIVGHSRGGLPSARLAMLRPDLIAALVVVDSNTLAPPSPLVLKDFYPRAFAGMGEHPDGEQAGRELVMNSFATDHITEELLASRVHAGASEKSLYARRLMASGRYAEQFLPDAERLRAEALEWAEAGRLTVDTLVMWGREDPSAPLPIGYELYDIIGSAGACRVELHVINRAGHYPYREAPAAFGQALRGFLAAGAGR